MKSSFQQRQWLLLVLVSGLTTASCGQEKGPRAPVTLAKVTAPSSTDWPQWRGPNRDGLAGSKKLLKKWPAEGPKLLWTYREAGMGYSSPSIVGDHLYLLGAQGESTIAFAINVATGERIWTTPIDGVLGNDWGDGPRGAPTVDGDYVYCLTGEGTLACLERSSGAKVWAKNLVRDFAGAIPNWGYAESPLVDGDRVVATPGGANFLVALDKMTGEKILSSTGLNDEAQYSSIVKCSVDKRQMYVTMTKNGAVGIDAESGKFLWRFEKTGNATAVIPTPTVAGNLVFTTCGYGVGCGLVRLKPTADGVEAEEIYFNNDMKNKHEGTVLVDGNIYGFSDGAGWMCMDLKTGETRWLQRRGVARGSIAYADGALYCYTEDGDVILADANPKEWREISRFRIPEQTTFDRKQGRIWTHPVIAGGKLYLRDQELVFCYDLER